MQDHIRQLARGDLADRRAAVDMVDRLEIEIDAEIEMSPHLGRLGAPLLVGVVTVMTSMPLRSTLPTIRSPRNSSEGLAYFFGWPWISAHAKRHRPNAGKGMANRAPARPAISAPKHHIAS
jgi:hypothetical protein